MHCYKGVELSPVVGGDIVLGQRAELESEAEDAGWRRFYGSANEKLD